MDVSESVKKTEGDQRPNAELPRSAQPDRPRGKAARTILLVIVVAAACYVSYGFGKLWAEWRQASQPVATRQLAPVNLESTVAGLPLSGQWSIANIEWNFRSKLVAQEDVGAELAELAAPISDHAVDQLPDISEEFVQLAENLKIQPLERDGNRIYSLDRHDLKAQLVVRVVSGHFKAIAMAAAYPQGDGEWQLFEFTPRASSGNLDAEAPHLMPLPAGATRNGGRFADDGRPLLELISLDSNADQLVSKWKDDGWVVKPSGLGSADAFSYLCVRGDEVIYAWSADPLDALQNLMLVRTPNSADTSP